MFRMDPFLSKPEIKQYVEKLYDIKCETVNTFLHKGKIMKGDGGKKWRKSDFKKAIITTDLKVPPMMN